MTKRKRSRLKPKNITFGPDGKLLSEELFERFKKLGITRKEFAARHGFNAREVGRVLRGSLDAHLSSMAGVAYVLGITLDLQIHKPSVLELLAYAAAGIDPFKVERF